MNTKPWSGNSAEGFVERRKGQMNTKPSVVFSDPQRVDFPSIGQDRYLRNLRSAGWNHKEFGGPLSSLSGFDQLTEHAAAVFMRRPWQGHL